MTKYRCPYCHKDLTPPETWTSSACPFCGKVLGLPDGIGRKKEEAAARKAAKERIWRRADAERRRLGLDSGPAKGGVFGRRGQVVISMAVVTLVGGLLVGRSNFFKNRLENGNPADRILRSSEELEVLATALGLYKAHTGHYPTAGEGALAALVADPGCEGWNGPYINALQHDPWGRGYRYDPSTEPPAVSSNGPDKRPGTEDDLTADPVYFTPDPRLLEEWRGAPVRTPTVRIWSAGELTGP